MEEVDTLLFRCLLKGDHDTKQQQHLREAAHGRTKHQEEKLDFSAEDQRDDAGPETGDPSAKDRSVLLLESANGTIRVQVPRESRAGLSFLRGAPDAPLRIESISPDSLFASTPLVPGLIVLQINGEDMIWESPEGAHDKILSPSSDTISIAVQGYVGKMTKQTKNVKLGLVLKDSTSSDGVFISNIKEGSAFHNTDLRVGLQVVAINKRPCPTEILKAIKRLQRARGELEIVAIDPSQIHERKSLIQEEKMIYPPSQPVNSKSNKDETIKVLDEKVVYALSPSADSRSNKEETTILPDVPSVESKSSKEERAILPDEMVVCAPSRSVHSTLSTKGSYGEETLPCEINFRESVAERQKEAISSNPAVQQSLLFMSARSYSSVSATSRTRNFEDEALEERSVALAPSVDNKAAEETAMVEDLNESAAEPPRLSAAFRDVADFVAEFVEDHVQMAEKATRQFLGENKATLILGEKASKKWRVIDVSSYCPSSSEPSIVQGIISQPTPPMILRLNATESNSLAALLYFKELPPAVGIKVPAEKEASLNMSQIKDAEVFYDATSEDLKRKGGVIENEPGVVISRMEMAFAEKFVVVAKKRSREKGRLTKLVVACENILISVDKLCK